jgi:hypothetical protein
MKTQPRTYLSTFPFSLSLVSVDTGMCRLMWFRVVRALFHSSKVWWTRWSIMPASLQRGRACEVVFVSKVIGMWVQELCFDSWWQPRVLRLMWLMQTTDAMDRDICRSCVTSWLGLIPSLCLIWKTQWLWFKLVHVHGTRISATTNKLLRSSRLRERRLVLVVYCPSLDAMMMLLK